MLYHADLFRFLICLFRQILHSYFLLSSLGKLNIMTITAHSKRVPNCLRKYRRISGYSQKDVANVLGLKSSSRISRWEKGECFPNITNLFRLAVLYRTMVDALFIDLLEKVREEIHLREKEIFDVRKSHAEEKQSFDEQ